MNVRDGGDRIGGRAGGVVELGNEAALEKIASSFQEMIAHDGFGELKVEVRILKRGQKEVIVHFGKQYRFVVDA